MHGADFIARGENLQRLVGAWQRLFESLAGRLPRGRVCSELSEEPDDSRHDMTTREEIAAKWTERGFRCDLWTDPPGQRRENFTHATDEVVIVLEGDKEFEVEGQLHRPRPGEELLIPARAELPQH